MARKASAKGLFPVHAQQRRLDSVSLWINSRLKPIARKLNPITLQFLLSVFGAVLVIVAAIIGSENMLVVAGFTFFASLISWIAGDLINEHILRHNLPQLEAVTSRNTNNVVFIVSLAAFIGLFFVFDASAIVSVVATAIFAAVLTMLLYAIRHVHQ